MAVDTEAEKSEEADGACDDQAVMWRWRGPHNSRDIFLTDQERGDSLNAEGLWRCYWINVCS